MATVACSACARPIPAGAHFCPSCGTPVARSSTAIEERRVVTVLFADLVGYTTLAEHLDPEAVTRLIESCFQPLVVEIEAFGGRVDKVLGDAIIALFGAPVAHEDDADRAVRAALRMQETLTRLVDERVDAGDPVADIQMRIGINTGEVLVGTVAGSDYTAMGDVVNTASRLQALAPPGSVLIGAATEALCSTAVAREPFGETQLRGRQQAEQPWIVTGGGRRRLPPGALRHPVRRPPRRTGAARVDHLARPHRPQRRGHDRRRAGLRQVAHRRSHHHPARRRGDRARDGVRPLRRDEPVVAAAQRAGHTARPRPQRHRRRRSPRRRTALEGALVAAAGRRPARPAARRHRPTSSVIPPSSTSSTRQASATGSPTSSPQRCAATPRHG